MRISSTPIPGLLLIDLDVHEDSRGWFKENWQREKMIAAGLPDFRPIQQNVSMNARGVTRGIHAEPWDKLISVASGSVHGAWVDLREGHERTHFSVQVTPDRAVFVPRGVANGFQALEDNTAYIYLVNDHWSPEANYVNLNIHAVEWPLKPTAISEKDRTALIDTPSMPAKKILVTGADGQLGRALRAVLPAENSEFCSREAFDITSPPARPWRQYSAIINAAAFTDVDKAEEHCAAAWAVNATGPAKLAAIAAENNLTLVQVSTDYVFDGSAAGAYSEDAAVSPISVYGASKAAGEAAAQVAPKHYVVRTSWLAGEGNNFVSAMASLAQRSIEPQVVHDQRGRPTFAIDLAKAIQHLLSTEPEYGIYHVTGGGDAVGRDEVAMATFIGLGHDPAEVHPVSTAEYYGDRPFAPRPANSELSTAKIEATGFIPQNWRVSLALYIPQICS